ncbi:hypothetical protein C8R46DRAFT_386192 [Mycena filopes]|nr:hypothetical protein C8R46DRAFT_386192 [Mycena filopes]
MCGHDLLHPPPTSARSDRRRSADIGGLSLALKTNHGNGWLGHGHHDHDLQTPFAELLSDMYTQTLNAVNEHAANTETSPELPPETRAQLIAALDGWNFEPNTLPSEDYIAACAILIFEALFRIEGLEEAVGVKLAQIPPFITHLRHIYRWQNSYHNFEHALDVLQATYSYLRAAYMVPPLAILLTPAATWKSSRKQTDKALITLLTPPDLLVLLLAAIGHDVGHPGFTNAFMANAAAPLSLVFDGESALERMHVALLLRVMRSCGLGGLLDPSRGDSNSGARASGNSRSHTKRLLVDTVLATDMRVHDAFMTRFADLLAARGDTSLPARRTVLCQAIIKCADISNPSRPYYISQHWASALLREWNNQAALEVYHHLPATVPAAPPRRARSRASAQGGNGGTGGDRKAKDKEEKERQEEEAREQEQDDTEAQLREASSQMFFIPGFVKPLLDLVVRGVPEMKTYAAQCDLNLALWTARLAILKKGGRKKTPKPHSKSKASTTNSEGAEATSESARDEEDADVDRDDEDDYTAFPLALYSNAFPLALPPAPVHEPPSPHSHGSHLHAYEHGHGRGHPWTRPPSFSASSTRPPSSVGLSRGGGGVGGGSEEEEEAGSEASFVFSPSSRGTSTTSASAGGSPASPPAFLDCIP